MTKQVGTFSQADIASLLIAPCEGATGAAACVVHEAQADALRVKLLVFGSGANQSIVALSLPQDEKGVKKLWLGTRGIQRVLHLLVCLYSSPS